MVDDLSDLRMLSDSIGDETGISKSIHVGTTHHVTMDEDRFEDHLIASMDRLNGTNPIDDVLLVRSSFSPVMVLGILENTLGHFVMITNEIDVAVQCRALSHADVIAVA